MPTEITLPQLGESVHEGTISRWLKKPGDRVEKYEPLVEIVTDKVNVEMPSPFEGVLREIRAEEGATVPAGAVIALFDDVAGAPAVGAAPATVEAPAAAPAAEPAATGAAAAGARPEAAVRPGRDGMRLSPLVRKLAEEHSLSDDDLRRIAGTGAGGRITKDDVLKYLDSRAAPPAPAARPAAAPPRPAEAARAAEGDTLQRLSPVRRTIAERMAQSKREIPHAYGIVEADVTDLVRWREASKDAFLERHGTPLTFTAFFVRAAAIAIQQFPIVNSAWSDEGIIVRRRVNVGVAAAVDEGLIVPVIHDADGKNLVGVARDVERLSRLARDGKLGLDDIQGGTFTITNPGVFGSILSMPIIVPGQAAILATDAIVRRPVVRDDAIAIRSIMHLGLSFDHRIFDGATAVRFLNAVKAALEKPEILTG